MRIGEVKKSFRKDESGAALLEMSVVFPVLLTISLGVIEFGNAIYSQHLVFNGVRDAARYVAGLPFMDSAFVSPDTVKVAANKVAGKNIAVWGTTTTTDTCDNSSTAAMKLTRRVSWWCNAAQVSIDYVPLADSKTNICGSVASPAYCRGRDKGGNVYTVTVTATVPYQQLGFLSYLGLIAPTLNVSHTERVYGVR